MTQRKRMCEVEVSTDALAARRQEFGRAEMRATFEHLPPKTLARDVSPRRA
jgi:hypothetical protein